MARRGVLTDREREVIRGEADGVENPGQYRSKIRTRLGNRAAKLEEDMEILDEYEPEIAENIRERICEPPQERLDRLQSEIEGLREQLDNE